MLIQKIGRELTGAVIVKASSPLHVLELVVAPVFFNMGPILNLELFTIVLHLVIEILLEVA